MEIENIRTKLHHFIDSIENKKVEAIYTIFENEIDLDSLRKKIIFQERENYLNGKGKSFSWADVKEMAIDKEKRNAV